MAICLLIIMFFMVLGFIESYPGISIIIIIGGIILTIYVVATAKDNREKRIVELKDLFRSKTQIEWNYFFNMDYGDRKAEIEEFIKVGISKGMFKGKLTKTVFSEPYTDLITKETLLFLDDLAINKDMLGYSFVDINRTSNPLINTGTYVYKFSDNNDIILLKAPFNITTSNTDNLIPIFDSNLISDKFILENDMIKDFQVFGNQMIQTDINLNVENPSVGTVLSEVVLGPSYSILKGISRVSVESNHTVKDARVVQVIFVDQTDIEFGGITIFYDFNRRLGNVKNKAIINNKVEKTISNQESVLIERSYAAELREIKLLFDEDIITSEEFEAKKKSLLNL